MAVMGLMLLWGGGGGGKQSCVYVSNLQLHCTENLTVSDLSNEKLPVGSYQWTTITTVSVLT